MPEPDSETAIIDWDKGVKILGGDKDFHRELLDSALMEINSLKPKLVKALDAQDQETAQRLAHTIKGAARAVAAMRTTKAAARVERAAAEGNFEEANEGMPALQQAVSELAAEITSQAS